MYKEIVDEAIKQLELILSSKTKFEKDKITRKSKEEIETETKKFLTYLFEERYEKIYEEGSYANAFDYIFSIQNNLPEQEEFNETLRHGFIKKIAELKTNKKNHSQTLMLDFINLARDYHEVELDIISKNFSDEYTQTLDSFLE